MVGSERPDLINLGRDQQQDRNCSYKQTDDTFYSKYKPPQTPPIFVQYTTTKNITKKRWGYNAMGIYGKIPSLIRPVKTLKRVLYL